MGLAPHIIVIGAGLIGLSCADSLLAKGAQVTIIEKGPTPGHGAGRYNSGMIHPSQAAPWTPVDDSLAASDLVLNLAVKSQALLKSRRANLKCYDVDRPSGTLQIFDNPIAGQNCLRRYQDLGISAKTDFEGWSFERFSLYFPGDEAGDAFHYCQLLSHDIARRGGRFICGAEARLAIHSEGCLGVIIDGKILKADHIVIACGRESAAVLRDYNIELPIIPMKGHALCFDRPSDINLPSIPIMHWDSRSALTVFETQVRLSGTVDEANPDILFGIWAQIAPNIVNRLGPPIVAWSADRPVSKLGRPIIGQTPIQNLWVNSGHGHMGWSLCTASGALMADMILAGKTAPEFELIA